MRNADPTRRGFLLGAVATSGAVILSGAARATAHLIAGVSRNGALHTDAGPSGDPPALADLKFPRPPFADYAKANLRAAAIRSCGALLHENQQMGRGASEDMRLALLGQAVVYRADVAGERLTLVLYKIGGAWFPNGARWFLVETGGVASRAASQDALRRIHAWLGPRLRDPQRPDPLFWCPDGGCGPLVRVGWRWTCPVSGASRFCT